ncbi:MAG: DUF2132 domain-containing protein, partial [Kluyvera cryocrescens]|nr:DUF2132 domain-containing protein [Kluyvera cryocrescens]
TPWARTEVEALYLDSLADMVEDSADKSPVDPWANSRVKKDS